jgi:hypothetical protein
MSGRRNGVASKPANNDGDSAFFSLFRTKKKESHDEKKFCPDLIWKKGPNFKLPRAVQYRGLNAPLLRPAPRPSIPKNLSSRKSKFGENLARHFLERVVKRLAVPLGGMELARNFFFTPKLKNFF